MTTYTAQIDNDGTVLRVIVAPSNEWATDRLGGTWVDTVDPYTPTDSPVVYTGPGHHHDPGVVERFVGDEWSSEKATVPDPESGLYVYRFSGMLTWHNGRAWRNLMPDGNPNVWEPGVASWREYPMGNNFPLWIQPVGSVDAYPMGFVVEHNGSEWQSNVEANVWEPGATGSESLWLPYPVQSVVAVPQILPDPPDWKFYTVQAGDTLFALVARANQRPNADDITIAQAQEWNGIGTANLIFEGQVLRYI